MRQLADDVALAGVHDGPDGLDALTLDDVRTAVQAQLRPDLLELSEIGRAHV